MCPGVPPNASNSWGGISVRLVISLSPRYLRPVISRPVISVPLSPGNSCETNIPFCCAYILIKHFFTDSCPASFRIRCGAGDSNPPRCSLGITTWLLACYLSIGGAFATKAPQQRSSAPSVFRRPDVLRLDHSLCPQTPRFAMFRSTRGFGRGVRIETVID
jgi:hypothetical protein